MNNFEYDTAYPFCNHLDLQALSTAIENDGADDFFGTSDHGSDIVLPDIKQEVMSPIGHASESESTENSTSEYMTPMANSIDVKKGGRFYGIDSHDESGEDKENISNTPVNRQLVLGNSSPNETLKDASPATPIDTLNVAMKSMRLSTKKLTASARKSVKFLEKQPEKIHPMETRLDTVVNTPTIVLRSRSVIRKSQACFIPAPVSAEKNKDPVADEAQVPLVGKELNYDTEENRDDPELPTTSTEDQKNDDGELKDNTEEQKNDAEGTKSIRQSPLPLPNLRMKPFILPDKVPLVQQTKRKASPHVVPKSKVFVSMAEELYKFQRKTPNRFHTRPPGSTKFPSGRPSMALKTTIPQSPALMAKSRSRPVNLPTQEEKEEEELKEIQSHKVKALPLNQNIFKTPNLGKPVEKRSVTKVKPFNLTEVHKTERPKTPGFSFCARPVPKGLLEGPTGVGEKALPKLTEPVAPSFEERRIAHVKRTAVVITEKGGQKVMGQQAIFHFGTPNRGHRKPTEVVPFSFHERDKELQEKKEQKIKKLLEEERKKTEFHANPLPRSIGGAAASLNNNAVLPNMPVLSMFLNDGYLAKRENLIKTKKQEEEDQLKKMAVFKARPATVIHSRPFAVKKVEPPTLEIEPFNFRTERRLIERQEFENELKENEAELIEARKQWKKENDEKEAEEVAKIRSERVHHAKPVPKSKPFTIKTSDKELTVPISPFRQNKDDQK